MTVAQQQCRPTLSVSDPTRRRGPMREHVYLLGDNARSHVAKVSSVKIQELGWEVLPHPPQHHRDIENEDRHHLEEVSHFFSSQLPQLGRRGVERLPW